MCKCFNFITNLFKKEKCEFEIPTTAFPWSKYGIGIHDVFQSLDDYKKMITYSGPFIRTDIPWWEVGENNFSRLDEFLKKCSDASKDLGLEVYPIIVTRGWTNSLGEDKSDIKMTPDMPQSQRDNAAALLGLRLANELQGTNIFCVEGWNEPDHDNKTEGFYVNTNEDRFTALASHLISSMKPFRDVGIKTAFAPFMTLNDSKFVEIEEVWNLTKNYFDYFSFHYYDDDPSKICYWATKTFNMIGNIPVICTEHGSQSNKSKEYYRQSAWSMYKVFGNNFKAVLNYCYDGHDTWALKNSDLLWNITHDVKP